MSFDFHISIVKAELAAADGCTDCGEPMTATYELNEISNQSDIALFECKSCGEKVAVSIDTTFLWGNPIENQNNGENSHDH